MLWRDVNLHVGFHISVWLRFSFIRRRNDHNQRAPADNVPIVVHRIKYMPSDVFFFPVESNGSNLVAPLSENASNLRGVCHVDGLPQWTFQNSSRSNPDPCIDGVF